MLPRHLLVAASDHRALRECLQRSARALLAAWRSPATCRRRMTTQARTARTFVWVETSRFRSALASTAALGTRFVATSSVPRHRCHAIIVGTAVHTVNASGDVVSFHQRATTVDCGRESIPEIALATIYRTVRDADRVFECAGSVPPASRGGSGSAAGLTRNGTSARCRNASKRGKL